MLKPILRPRPRHRVYPTVGVESLEPRTLMSAAAPVVGLFSNYIAPTGRPLAELDIEAPADPTLTLADPNIPDNPSLAPVGGIDGSDTSGGYTTQGIPVLHSDPGAAATLYLCFTGDTTASWGPYTNIITPAYDTDGDPSTFNDQEIANIRQIWARVAEDYAPFNIDVTTVNPGSFQNGQALRVDIGGSGAWLGSVAGGVAYTNTFVNSVVNTAFVFPGNLANGFPKYVADAASHEAGHTFGLEHQALWNGSQMTSEYNPGNSKWAPLMGNSYSAAVSTWWNGKSAAGVTQDDLAIIGSQMNGFGFRPDDYANTADTASAVTPDTLGNFSLNGIIGNTGDADFFNLNVGDGPLSISCDVAPYGANLDSELDLFDSAGNLVASSNPVDSLASVLSLDLTAGVYRVAVRSAGGYGYLGQYVLSGTVTPPDPFSTPDPGSGGDSGSDPGDSGHSGGTVTPPPLHSTSTVGPILAITLDNQPLRKNPTLNFPAAFAGDAAPTVVLTLTNTGDADLNLSDLTLPAGFSVVGQTPTLLHADESATLTIAADTTDPATLVGDLTFTSNDPAHAGFTAHLAATVLTPPDAYESNDSRLAVDGDTPGAPNSPNLGTITSPLTIDHLNTTDATEDWFAFTTTAFNTASAGVQIAFNHAQGNLDLYVYRTDGTLVGRSTGGRNDIESVSLSNQGPGTYYVRVVPVRGARVSDYNLTITPDASAPVVITSTAPLTFYDAAAHRITARLTGSGSATLAADPATGQLTLNLTGTDDSSSLSLRATGHGGTPTLASVSVTGSLARFIAPDYDLQGDFTVTGTLAGLTLDAVNGAVSKSITLQGTGVATRLSLGAVNDLTLTSASPLSIIRVDGWRDLAPDVDHPDQITAPSIANLFSGGNWEADLDLTGPADPATSLVLGRVNVFGDIGAVNWNLAGDVGPLAANGTNTGFILDAADHRIAGVKLRLDLGGTWTAASIGSVSAGESDAALSLSNTGTMLRSLTIKGNTKSLQIDGPGAIGSVRAANWYQGELHAGSIGSLSITGNLNSADVQLTDPAALLAFRSLRVGGTILNTNITAAANAGSLTAAAMNDSNLLLGTHPGVAHPTDAGDFDALLSIRSIGLRGFRGFSDPTFINSNIAAATIGRAKLGLVQTANGGTPFGIQTQNYTTLNWTTGPTRSDRITLTRSAPPPAPTDDFAVSLI